MTDNLMRESSKEDLKSLLKINPELKNIQPLHFRREHAKSQSTLIFLLITAYNELFQKRDIKVAHSFADGFFCQDIIENFEITEEMVQKTKEKIDSYINGKDKIETKVMKREDLIQIFKQKNFVDKTKILKVWRVDNIPVICFRNQIDYEIEPVQKDLSKLLPFALIKYKYGMLIRFPTLSDPKVIEEFQDLPRTWNLIKEHEKWIKQLNCETISDLNSHVFSKTIDRIKWVAEGMHEKKLGEIADDIIKHYPKKKIITIAGPSSSGKTTFAKRLSIHIGVNGYTTKVISMDDFYRDTVDIAIDENGDKDFEAISAMNIKLLVERLSQLTEGKEIPVRKFDFVKGTGADDPKEKIKLNDNEFVILEGIHGLNPSLTEKIGLDKVSRIFVCPFGQLNIDHHHRISSNDNRLLRRMIRDFQFRNWSPSDTLIMWTNVRKGEEKYINPYQELNDYMFNTSLIYELPVLATYAKPLISEVTGVQDLEKEAGRLLRFLSFYYHIPGERVPGISLMREFIGNSDFRY
ncbi:phosphoribulokinase family protein-related protein [Anaeramoeba ignava]|uniref:Phosphoribulokinase family protein-related protein n=1 Tax=Anaeramoeba ignava TaxID=1746090 RepID=A0A9Q0RE49_ANAIG|nr:phosphoribulokinase family protein-related protein [Anaeramoeba ignava]